MAVEDDEEEWVKFEDIESAKYFVETTNGYVREWPGALYRRAKLAGHDSLYDASWTVSQRWERSLVFIAHEFGSSDGECPRG